MVREGGRKREGGRGEREDGGREGGRTLHVQSVVGFLYVHDSILIVAFPWDKLHSLSIVQIVV